MTRQGIVAALAALAAFGAFAGSALASSASVSGNTLAIAGGPESSDIRLAEVGVDQIRVDDTAGVSAGAGCDQLEPTAVVCGDASTTAVNAALGEGDDRLDATSVFFTPAITADGGPGNDYIGGSESPDSLNGGDGDDFVGGSFGNDVVNGGAGNDELSGSQDNDVVRGDDGNDDVNGDHGDDEAHGDAGADTVNGGSGNDRVVGGADADTLVGDAQANGSGNDSFEARDGVQDTVGCGLGADVVSADTRDVTDLECEQVDRESTTPGGGSSQEGPSFEASVERASILRGLLVELTIDSQATVDAALVLSPKRAKRVGLRKRRTVIGASEGRTPDAGTYELRLRLRARFARKFEDRERLKAALVIRATDASGATKRDKLPVLLKG